MASHAERAESPAYAPSRRSVVRAAAWTMPAVSIAVAAPAFAVSGPAPCSDGTYVIRWAEHYDAGSRSATALLTGQMAGSLGNAPLTMTVSNRFNGRMTAGSVGGYSNLAVSPDAVGGTGTRGLTLMQRATVSSLTGQRSSHNQQVTLTFSRPVRDLRFSFCDIDSLDPPASGGTDPDGQYQDRVFVTGRPAGSRAANVLGTGTSADPWRPSGTNGTLDPVTDGRGNVAVSYVGRPESSVYTITYWNDQSGTLSAEGLQGVFLTNLSFTASTCA